MTYDIIFKLIIGVGFPITAAVLSAIFVYYILKYILDGVVLQIKGLQNIIIALDDRVKNMNHDIIRVDVTVSSALGLRQDLERIARADGKSDTRRD
jgi:hypothetical protein